MRPAWVTQYLGIPFLEKGRTHAGVDCYGLVRLIYQEQRGLALPSYSEQYATTADAREIIGLLKGEVASNWAEISIREARLFDGLVFRLMGQPTHVGLVLDPPWFIHAIKVVAGRTVGKTRIDRWDSIGWERRVLAAVQWQGA